MKKSNEEFDAIIRNIVQLLGVLRNPAKKTGKEINKPRRRVTT